MERKTCNQIFIGVMLVLGAAALFKGKGRKLPKLPGLRRKKKGNPGDES